VPAVAAAETALSWASAGVAASDKTNAMAEIPVRIMSAPDEN
jgi:hypothetical protein